MKQVRDERRLSLLIVSLAALLIVSQMKLMAKPVFHISLFMTLRNKEREFETFQLVASTLKLCSKKNLVHNSLAVELLSLRRHPQALTLEEDFV